MNEKTFPKEKALYTLPEVHCKQNLVSPFRVMQISDLTGYSLWHLEIRKIPNN